MTTTENAISDKDQRGGREVTVRVNTKPVWLAAHRVAGLEVKQAAIAQGVEIEEDFLLTLEAHGGRPARTVDDDEVITVTRHSVFTANDGDDDS
ncbi:MAG TPA: multiubiquitin domain-containing protein [Miltoncostaeaceae bacterium]|nr:multiubiquitin domain-containing protein [Miltoncostaeaceae bacterium]